MKSNDTFFNPQDLNLIKKLDIKVFNETESTNIDAKKIAESSDNDALFIAFKQTGGKGRMGRTFYSPENAGIYMSLLLHPKIKTEDSLFLTTAAAVKVACALEKLTEKQMQIKWVNDIYFNNKKVCGILTTAASSQNEFPSYVIIGIGININTPQNGYPNEIKDIATSLFGSEYVSSQTKAALISDIVNGILNELDTNDKLAHLKEYKRRNMLLGKEVFYIKNGQTHYGTVTDIDDNCALVLKDSNGKTVNLFAGEVSVRENLK